MKGFIFAAIALLIATTDAVLVNPLPKPQYIAWSEKSGPISLSKNFKIITPKNTILEEAAQRTVHTIWKEQWVPVAIEQPIPKFPAFPPATGFLNKRAPHSSLDAVTVKVDDLKADLQLGVDEWYELVISASGGSIHAHTVWGALRAFETLNQIVIGNEEHNGQVLIEHPVHIKDWANYSHRGLLLDTGRNFYPVPAILRTIDGLAWSKLNVLHWHIEDTQSWPLQLKAYPEMTKDAYSKRETYSHSDVNTIVQYARARGVRVIPEIDSPGHSASGWQQIDPQAVACANSWWDNDEWTHHSAVEPNPGQLDIAYEPTYEIIKNVYDEVASLFPDTAYHAGFDELQKYCYNYSSHVNDWFKANPTLDYTDLAQYYLDKALPIFQSKKKHVIMWEDVVKTDSGFNAKNVDKSVILQSWNYGTENIKYMTSLGHQVIVTSSDWFYLDCGFGGFVSNDRRYDVDVNPDPSTPNYNFGAGGGSWCAPYKTWQRIYDYDFTFNLTAAETKLVIGAEVAMWSEQSDATVVDSKVWPRAAALAESLWSGNRNATGFKRYNEFTQRINDFRERLVVRGINASPLMPRYCLQHPHTCDLFLQQ